MCILHTGLYSDHAFKTFSAMMSLIKNFHGFKRKLAGTALAHEADGEIILCNKENCTGGHLFSMPAHEAKRWLAHYNKVVTRVATSPESWRRDNDEPFFAGDYTACGRIAVVVKDLHFLYDFLLDHKNLEHKYSREFIQEFVGKPLDPIAAECERAKRAALEKLKAELQLTLSEIDAQDRKMREELALKTSARRAAARFDYDAKVAAIKAQAPAFQTVS